MNVTPHTHNGHCPHAGGSAGGAVGPLGGRRPGAVRGGRGGGGGAAVLRGARDGAADQPGGEAGQGACVCVCVWGGGGRSGGGGRACFGGPVPRAEGSNPQQHARHAAEAMPTPAPAACHCSTFSLQPRPPATTSFSRAESPTNKPPTARHSQPQPRAQRQVANQCTASP